MSKNGKILTVGSWGCYRAENNPKKSLLVLWLSTRGHNFNFLLWYQQRVVVYTFIPFTPPLYCTPVRLYGYPKIHIIEMGHLQKGPWFSDRGTWGPNIMDTYLGWVDTPDEVYKWYLPQKSLSSITTLAEQSSVKQIRGYTATKSLVMIKCITSLTLLKTDKNNWFSRKKYEDNLKS